MAKPKSEGFPYCQQDTDTFFDPKIRTLIARFGCDGYAVWDYIKQAAYREHGYYVEWDDDRRELASADLYISVEKLGMIEAYLLKRSLLLSKSFNGITVLTSHGIQARFQKMAKETKRTYIFRKDIWVLSEAETLGFIFHTLEKNNSGIKADNSGINPLNSGIMQQKKSKVNNIPPLSPNGGREEGKERFFSAYPKLKGMAKLDDSGIDYDALYQHFQRSEFLRSRFSAKWVIENYADIIAGVHDDKTSAEEQARARAEWYRQRREGAEEIADVNQAKAEERCGDIIREIKRLEIAISKAEARGEEDSMMGEAKALLNERDRLEKALAVIGLTESDLRPRYRCRKCSDTGYLPNGKPCDCYEKLKGEKE